MEDYEVFAISFAAVFGLWILLGLCIEKAFKDEGFWVVGVACCIWVAAVITGTKVAHDKRKILEPLCIEKGGIVLENKCVKEIKLDERKE